MDIRKLLAEADPKQVDERLKAFREATANEDPETAAVFVLYLPLDPETSKLFTKERLRVLCLLRDRGPLTMGDVAQELGRNSDAVSRDVRFLVNMGVLELERDESDGRRKVVRLSPAEVRMTLAPR